MNKEIDERWLMIAGSRNLTSIDISPYIPENIRYIITGGAAGVDTLAEQYADSRRISKIVIRPRYDLYGRKAPLIRNRQIIDFCDEVLIFWDGRSRGTKYTIDYALNSGKKLTVIQVNKAIDK